MITAVDEALDAECEDLAGVVEDVDPSEWSWLPGVEYAAGWRAARVEAGEIDALLTVTGLEPRQLRAVADTDAVGARVVRLVGSLGGWKRLEL